MTYGYFYPDFRRNEDKLCRVENATQQGLTVEVVTDMDEEPVELAEAKNHLKIDYTTDDDLIEMMIATARQMLEQYSGLSFGQKTIRLSLEVVSGEISLPFGPIESLDSVTIDGDTGIVDSDYKFYQYQKKVKLYSGYRNLEIVYTTKASEDLANIKTFKNAILAQVAFLYEHRGDEAMNSVCELAQVILAPFRTYNVF